MSHDGFIRSRTGPVSVHISIVGIPEIKHIERDPANLHPRDHFQLGDGSNLIDLWLYPSELRKLGVVFYEKANEIEASLDYIRYGHQIGDL